MGRLHRFSRHGAFPNPLTAPILPRAVPPPFCPAEMTKAPPEGISVGLEGDNLFAWEVMMVGPPGTL
jgi:hypothetical protein